MLVLLNAASGAGIDERTQEYLAAHATGALKDVELIVINDTNVTEMRRQAAEEIERGVVAVVVRGGDGMVNLGVNLVAGTGTPLGIVPAGSGNDFARSVGIPTANKHQALDSLIRAVTHPTPFTSSVDALRVRTSERELLVANSVNFGFDSLVNAEANALQKVPKSARYAVAIANLVAQGKLKFRDTEFTIELDGRPRPPQPATFIAALNGKSMGGGLKVAPSADIADGEFEVVRLDAIPAWKLAQLLPLLSIGAHTRRPEVHIDRVRRIRVTGPADIPVYADGDEIGQGGYEAEIVPAAWRLLRG